MDYKDTLNLPRTDFPMKADLVAREPQRLEKWQREKLYEKIQAARAGGEKFILHDGPPFANGDVHVGNALNKILKDFIVKYKTLRGYSAPYVPGWDCHGLPIEFKVMQEFRKHLMKDAPEGMTAEDWNRLESRQSLSPDGQSYVAGVFAKEAGDDGIMKVASKVSPTETRDACAAYALKYIAIQREQFKRLGVLGDWENPYLTLNKEYEADELRLFADIVERGFVYRGKKPVYWSIPCRTALAEAEVEYKDHVSQSIYVKFPVFGQPNTYILIWTTTPWTLPANLAVAYNATFQYAQVKVGEENYILSRGLLPAIAEKCGWRDHIEQPIATAKLREIEYQHPFCARRGKLLLADFVTSDTGTGFVHIAPGHGQDDYNLGRAVGLPIYSPVDDDGRFAYTDDLPIEQQMPKELIGKAILEKHGKSDANEAVLHELRVRHALVHQENYHHSYPHCWRSKTPIIFRAMDQWFIRIDDQSDPVKAAKTGHPAKAALLPAVSIQTDDPGVLQAWGRTKPFAASGLRTLALGAIENVEWVPSWGKSRMQAAVLTRPDWCISRQRTWGVPIPAFYDAQGNAILDGQIVRNAADLVEQHGSNVWYEKSAAGLWSLLKPKDWNGAGAVSKSNDTLDVWIDSGSSSRTVLMRRAELNHAVGSSRRDDRGQPSGPSLPWQADMYLEGSDQHRGWFQSSLLLSLAGNGAAPYKTVLTHGFMVDADREKISKSKQGQSVYEKPQTAEAYVKKWGADIVRLWVASQDFRNDIIVSEERINKVAETYRVIRNALRYQLSNLYDFNPTKHTVPDDQLTGLDRWILSEFSKLEDEVIKAYDAYEFHVVYQKISQFAAVELSAIYHDVIKDRLYTDPANSHRRRSTQTALHRLVTGLCQMLAPILSFTADEAWEYAPRRSAKSVHESTWVLAAFSVSNEEADQWSKLFKLRNEVLTEIEKERQTKVLGKALEGVVFIRSSGEELKLVQENLDALRELLNTSSIEAEEGKGTFEIKSGILQVEVETDRRIMVRHAQGFGRKKCERCWRWETDVGSNPEHPTICGRCVEAVKQFNAAS